MTLASALVAALAYALWLLGRRIRHLKFLRDKQKELRLDEIQLSPDALWEKQRDDDFLRRAIQAVEENIDNEEYNVEAFSSDLCLSHMTVYRKLQALTGTSPLEFIRDIRLKKAAQLLRQHPGMTITQLASEVGFKTPSHFTKCFKAKFGVLPSQYKDQP